jgi:hypothetical protein
MHQECGKFRYSCLKKLKVGTHKNYKIDNIVSKLQNTMKNTMTTFRIEKL